jgi:hypothetical protein
MNRKMIAEAINIRVSDRKYNLIATKRGNVPTRQTVPSTAQIRTEGNNTKCVGKKRFNGSVTHGLRKEHMLRSPLLSFWTR